MFQKCFEFFNVCQILPVLAVSGSFWPKHSKKMSVFKNSWFFGTSAPNPIHSNRNSGNFFFPGGVGRSSPKGAVEPKRGHFPRFRGVSKTELNLSAGTPVSVFWQIWMHLRTPAQRTGPPGAIQTFQKNPWPAAPLTTIFWSKIGLFLVKDSVVHCRNPDCFV